MSSDVSFEVQSFKDGDWKTETVCHNKSDALTQARDILSGRHTTAVKVIEEIFDKETGDSRYKIVFKEEKGVKKKPKYRKIPKKKEPAVKTVTANKKKEKESVTKAIIKLVVILGGILLCGIVLIAAYVSYFSS